MNRPFHILVMAPILCVLGSAVGWTQSSAATVRMSGTVIDEDGTPLPGVSVLIQEQGGQYSQQRSTTTGNGAFNFPGVGRSSYTVCVTVTSGQYLNPCLWSPMREVVDTRLSGTAETRTIRISKAGLVRVVVSDPPGLTAGAPGQPGFQVGVWGSAGLYHPLVKTAESGSGTVYELAVPFDQDLRLGFQGRPLAVKLDQAALSTRNTVPGSFKVAKGGTGIREFRLDVVGLAQ